MKPEPTLSALFALIIDKLNRIEANVADLKSDPQNLRDAIDDAVGKLIAATTTLNRPDAK